MLRSIPGILDDGKDWQPPDDLADFLASGPKPVYIGFGGMFPRDAEHITRTVIAAIRKAGCRAVLATGWGGLALDAALRDENIFILQQAPHDWLFPRVAAAVHHGGVDTMAAAVRAGIPVPDPAVYHRAGVLVRPAGATGCRGAAHESEDRDSRSSGRRDQTDPEADHC